MLNLRVHQFELTYEAVLAAYCAPVIDTPGKVAAAMASEFNQFNVSLSDMDVDDGSLEERGLSCEVDELDASIELRGDRFRIRFSAADRTEVAAILGVWRALTACSPGVSEKSHTLFFEIDAEFADGTYGAALERFCTPPGGLPAGTETAVVYYLPPDSRRGLLDSSVVLNRSAAVEGGILIAATIVFEGGRVGREEVIPAGRELLEEILGNLEIVMGDR